MKDCDDNVMCIARSTCRYEVKSPNPILSDNLEDPFVFRDCRGGYHMLAHAIGKNVHEKVA